MTYYNVSLFNPDRPHLDPMSKVKWNNPLVTLDTAIRAAAGPNDIVIGDPTDFRIDPKTGEGSSIDWGWDLEIGSGGLTYGNQGRIPRQVQKNPSQEDH